MPLPSGERHLGQRGRARTAHQIVQAGAPARSRRPEPRLRRGVHGADGPGGPKDQDGEGARVEQSLVLRVGLFGVPAGSGLPVDAAPHEEGDGAHRDELDELGQALQAPVVREDDGRVHGHAPEDGRHGARKPEGERREGGGHEEERDQEEGQERAVGDVGVRGVVRQGDESDHPLDRPEAGILHGRTSDGPHHVPASPPPRRDPSAQALVAGEGGSVHPVSAPSRASPRRRWERAHITAWVRVDTPSLR